MLEGFSDLQWDLPSHILVQRDALHETVVLRVGRVLARPWHL